MIGTGTVRDADSVDGFAGTHVFQIDEHPTELHALLPECPVHEDVTGAVIAGRTSANDHPKGRVARTRVNDLRIRTGTAVVVGDHLSGERAVHAGNRHANLTAER